MTRYKGIKKVTEAFEPLLQAPLDARTEVVSFDDLLSAATWKVGDNHTFAYPGMRVFVKELGKWFKLKNKQFALRESWIEDDGLHLDYLEFVNETTNTAGGSSHPIECVYNRDNETYYAYTENGEIRVKRPTVPTWQSIGSYGSNPVGLLYNQTINKLNAVRNEDDSIEAHVYDFATDSWSETTVWNYAQALYTCNIGDRFVVFGDQVGKYYVSTDGVNYEEETIIDFPDDIEIGKFAKVGEWILGFVEGENAVYFIKPDITGTLKFEHVKFMPRSFSDMPNLRVIGGNGYMLIWEYLSESTFVLYDFAKETFFLDNTNAPVGKIYRIDNFLIENGNVISFGEYNLNGYKVPYVYYTIRAEELSDSLENGKTPEWISNFSTERTLKNYLCAIPAGNNNYVTFYGYEWQLFHFGKTVSQYGKKVTKELAKTIEPYLELDGGGLIRVNSLNDITAPKMNSIYKLEAMDTTLGCDVGEYVANVDDLGFITWHKINGLEAHEDEVKTVYTLENYPEMYNKVLTGYDEVNDVYTNFFVISNVSTHYIASKGEVFNPKKVGFESLTTVSAANAVAFNNGIGILTVESGAKYYLSTNGYDWTEKDFANELKGKYCAAVEDGILVWDENGNASMTKDGKTWSEIEKIESDDDMLDFTMHKHFYYEDGGVHQTFLFTADTSYDKIQTPATPFSWFTLDLGDHVDNVIICEDKTILYNKDSEETSCYATFGMSDIEAVDHTMPYSDVFEYNGEFYNVSNKIGEIRKLNADKEWDLVESFTATDERTDNWVFATPNYVAFWKYDHFEVWTKRREIVEDNKHKEKVVAKAIAPYLIGATKHRKGVVRMATDSEAEEGISTNTVISPSQLKKASVVLDVVPTVEAVEQTPLPLDLRNQTGGYVEKQGLYYSCNHDDSGIKVSLDGTEISKTYRDGSTIEAIVDNGEYVFWVESGKLYVTNDFKEEDVIANVAFAHNQDSLAANKTHVFHYKASVGKIDAFNLETGEVTEITLGASVSANVKVHTSGDFLFVYGPSSTINFLNVKNLSGLTETMSATAFPKPLVTNIVVSEKQYEYGTADARSIVISAIHNLIYAGYIDNSTMSVDQVEEFTQGKRVTPFYHNGKIFLACEATSSVQGVSLWVRKGDKDWVKFFTSASIYSGELEEILIGKDGLVTSLGESNTVNLFKLGYNVTKYGKDLSSETAKAVEPYIREATKVEQGMIRIATDEEADAGAINTAAINPEQLKRYSKFKVKYVEYETDCTDLGTIYKLTRDGENYPAGTYVRREWKDHYGDINAELVAIDGLHVELEKDYVTLADEERAADNIKSAAFTPSGNKAIVIYDKDGGGQELVSYRVNPRTGLTEYRSEDVTSTTTAIAVYNLDADKWVITANTTDTTAAVVVDETLGELNVVMLEDDISGYNDVAFAKDENNIYMAQEVHDDVNKIKLTSFNDDGVVYENLLSISGLKGVFEYDADHICLIASDGVYKITKSYLEVAEKIFNVTDVANPIVYAGNKNGQVCFAQQDQTIYAFVHKEILKIVESNSLSINNRIVSGIVNTEDGIYVACHNASDDDETYILYSSNYINFLPAISDEALAEFRDAGNESPVELEYGFRNLLAFRRFNEPAINKFFYFRTLPYDLTQDGQTLQERKLANVLMPVLRKASKDKAGIIKIATDFEVQKGTDDTTAVTPKQLRENSTSLKVETVEKLPDIEDALLGVAYDLTEYNDGYRPGKYVAKNELGVKSYVSMDGLREVKNDIARFIDPERADEEIVDFVYNDYTEEIMILWAESDTARVVPVIYSVNDDRTYEKVKEFTPRSTASPYVKALGLREDWVLIYKYGSTGSMSGIVADSDGEEHSYFSIPTDAKEIVSGYDDDYKYISFSGEGRKIRIANDDESRTLVVSRFDYGYNTKNCVFIKNGQTYFVLPDEHRLYRVEDTWGTYASCTQVLVLPSGNEVTGAEVVNSQILLYFDNQRVAKAVISSTPAFSHLEDVIPAGTLPIAGMHISHYEMKDGVAYVSYNEPDDGAVLGILRSENGETWTNVLSDEEIEEISDASLGLRMRFVTLPNGDAFIYRKDSYLDEMTFNAVYHRDLKEFALIQGKDDDQAYNVAKTIEDHLRYATNKVKGVIKIATDELVEIGIDETTAVNPKQLAEASIKKEARVRRKYMLAPEADYSSKLSIIDGGIVPTGKLDDYAYYHSYNFYNTDLTAAYRYTALDPARLISFVNANGEYVVIGTDFTAYITSPYAKMSLTTEANYHKLNTVELEGEIIGADSNFEQVKKGIATRKVDVFWTDHGEVITCVDDSDPKYWFDPDVMSSFTEAPTRWKLAFGEATNGFAFWSDDNKGFMITKDLGTTFEGKSKTGISWVYPYQNGTTWNIAYTLDADRVVKTLSGVGDETTNTFSSLDTGSYVLTYDGESYWFISIDGNRFYKIDGTPWIAGATATEILLTPDSDLLVWGTLSQFTCVKEANQTIFTMTGNFGVGNYLGYKVEFVEGYKLNGEMFRPFENEKVNVPKSFVGEYKYLAYKPNQEDIIKKMYGGYKWRTVGTADGINQYIRTA